MVIAREHYHSTAAAGNDDLICIAGKSLAPNGSEHCRALIFAAGVRCFSRG
jgi:hypothetical protein